MRGIYQRGDRAPWCQDGKGGVLVGTIVALPHGLVVIRTDDDIDRTACIEVCLRTEAILQQKGIGWK